MKGYPQRCARLRGSVRSGGGGDVTFNSLLRASLSLKLPLSCRTIKGLEAARDGQVESVFLIDMNNSLLIRNQEDSHLRRLMKN